VISIFPAVAQSTCKSARGASTDDPYDEDPSTIAHQIARGATAEGVAEGKHFMIELDRCSAFRTVLRQAGPGDGVLLATHGHLDQLVIGGEQAALERCHRGG
jgi:UDP-N-acetylmuramyl tripeptide synthase